MTYQLPPDIDQHIQSQIALGIYQTPTEVLNDALDILEQRNADLEAIHAAIEDEKVGRIAPFRTSIVICESGTD